jgi:hypothetical protein
MENWKIGKEVHFERGQTLMDEKICLVSHYYHGDKRGTSQHDVKMIRYKNGALSISDRNDEGWIYLYPEQVKHLRRVLRS